MIKNWTLQNFKSIKDRTTLEFAPLTVFTGVNSSGKSTVIQSILLVTQTLQSPVHSRSVVLNGHILKLGTYADVVTDNITDNNIMIGYSLEPREQKDSLHRSVALSMLEGLLIPVAARGKSRIDYTFSLSVGASPEPGVLVQPLLDRISLTVEMGDPRDVGSAAGSISAKRAPETAAQRARTHNLDHSDNVFLEYQVDTADYNPEFPVSIPIDPSENTTIIGISFTHFLPSHLYRSVDFAAHRAREFRILLEELLDPSRKTRDFTGLFAGMSMYPSSAWQYPDIPPDMEQIFVGTDFQKLILRILKNTQLQLARGSRNRRRIPKMLKSLKTDFTPTSVRQCYEMFPQKLKTVIGDELGSRKNELFRLLEKRPSRQHIVFRRQLRPAYLWATEYMREYFVNSVKYIGPLRDEPKPIYPLSSTADTKDVGYTGKYTAAVLHLHGNTEITYIPSSEFMASVTDPQPKTVELINAVLDWLAYMRVASDVDTEDKGKLGYELRVKTDACGLHDLIHVGVGVSQVLPILVLSLLADANTTLIFEQPELHLHPGVQTRLADFFVSMTCLGKQCVVETHSEYFINRLRYQAAIKEGQQVADDIVIYFVEKEDGYSHFRPIRINQFGVIEDWPKGFFDESEETSRAILKAAVEKRKQKREQRW